MKREHIRRWAGIVGFVLAILVTIILMVLSLIIGSRTG